MISNSRCFRYLYIQILHHPPVHYFLKLEVSEENCRAPQGIGRGSAKQDGFSSWKCNWFEMILGAVRMLGKGGRGRGRGREVADDVEW